MITVLTSILAGAAIILVVGAGASYWGCAEVAARPAPYRRHEPIGAQSATAASSGWAGSFASIIRHRGGRTGRAYETPVGVIADGGTSIVLAARATVEWLRDVLASGSATLVTEGRTCRSTGPRSSRPGTLADRLLPSDRFAMRLLGTRDTLRLRRAPPRPSPARRFRAAPVVAGPRSRTGSSTPRRRSTGCRRSGAGIRAPPSARASPRPAPASRPAGPSRAGRRGCARSLPEQPLGLGGVVADEHGPDARRPLDRRRVAPDGLAVAEEGLLLALHVGHVAADVVHVAVLRDQLERHLLAAAADADRQVVLDRPGRFRVSREW